VYKSKDKWIAQINIKNRKCYLGYAKVEEEAAQLVAKANKKYIVDREELISSDAVDISDVADEQPLIFRKDKELSKYQGKSRMSYSLMKSPIERLTPTCF